MQDLYIDDLEALHHIEQQRAELEEWLESEEGLRYINNKLIDSVYEEQYEIDCEV